MVVSAPAGSLVLHHVAITKDAGVGMRRGGWEALVDD